MAGVGGIRKETLATAGPCKAYVLIDYMHDFWPARREVMKYSSWHGRKVRTYCMHYNELRERVVGYLFVGPSGKHEITGTSKKVDLERAQAHWEGFCYGNGEDANPLPKPKYVKFNRWYE